MEIKPNNIYCGDCYKLIKEIPDKSVDLVYIDIPYLYSSGYGNRLKDLFVQKFKGEEDE